MSFSKTISIIGTSLSLISAVTIGYLCWQRSKVVNACRRHKIISKEELQTARWKSVGCITRLWLYPVKSCAPITLSEAIAKPHGLQTTEGSIRDRSYIIINNNAAAMMVTGRMCPKSVLVTPTVGNDGELTLSCPGQESITVSTATRNDTTPIVKQAKVWDDMVEGVDCGEEAADWLSAILKRNVRLLYHDGALASVNRTIDAGTTAPLPLLKSDDGAVYADLTGYTLISEASVREVGRLSERPAISPLNFRPNIVVSSLPDADMAPFAEDNWSYIKIGDDVIFRNVKPGIRCTFTCVDPALGTKDPDSEPFKTLKKHRMTGSFDGPLLGINLGLDLPGRVREGDIVYALTGES